MSPVELKQNGFRPYHKTAITYARPVAQAFRVTTETGETLEGVPGDYLCLDPATGGQWIVNQGIFEATYQPASEAPPISGFTAYRKHQVTWAKRITERSVIATREGNVVARPGDYLCIGVEGETWPQPAARFEANYEPA